VTRLQSIRLSKRMTRDDLAKAAKVDYGTIRRHELREGSVSEIVLFKLADALDVEPTDLIDPKPEQVAS
jgi:transcriptional regulator with XRE-family HTH domain